jgi:hypothetical protein
MTNTPRFPATAIEFEAAPLKVGTRWQVVATYPTGQKEQIGAFKSEAEAVTWIGGSQCLAWIKARGYE